MVNAHSLALLNASTSPVNASAAGCGNCPGSSENKGTAGAVDTPSFASLLDAQTNATPLEAQTNESTLVSEQQPAENDLATGLIAAPPASPETLPAAFLALAANDALLNGDQDVIDNIAPPPLKPDAVPADLIAKPEIPQGTSTPLPDFAANLDAIAGRIDPPATTGPNNIAGSIDQPVAVQTNPAGTIATSSTVSSPTLILAQDNLAQPAAPQTHVNAAGSPTTGDNPLAATSATIATNAAGQSEVAPSNQQPQSSPETPLVFNDNAKSPAPPINPVGNPVAEQVIAKANIGVDDSLLPRPTIGTEAKSGNVATKPNGEAAPASQNAAPAQPNPGGVAIPDAIAANKALANAGVPVIDANAPTKIEQNAPLTSTAATAPDADASPEGEARPATLMQRLKPLAQAAFSFQNMENAQNSAKTVDGLVPAISMTATGDLARPSAITGLTPTSNNPALPQVPLNNIAVHIASQASAGNQRFNIRLDPPELGRIDIRLEISRDGQTMTHLAVEKPETLDLLRQDSRALERALNNAGLDSRNGSLSFSLKDDSQDKQQARSSQSDGTPDGDEPLIEQDVDEPVVTRTLNMSSGLDISI